MAKQSADEQQQQRCSSMWKWSEILRWQKQVHSESHLRSTCFQTMHLSQCMVYCHFCLLKRHGWSQLRRKRPWAFCLVKPERCCILMGFEGQDQKRAPASLVWGLRGKPTSVFPKRVRAQQGVCSWVPFYMFLGKPATCAIAATAQLCSIIFSLNVTRKVAM